MSGERSYPDPSSSPQPPSPPRNGEEKGEKEWGFEAGGFAARLKPPGFPPPRAAQRQRGGGQGGRESGRNAQKSPKHLGEKSSCTWCPSCPLGFLQEDPPAGRAPKQRRAWAALLCVGWERDGPGYACRAISTRRANVAASRTAMSASTFRSSATPARLRPAMKRL